MSGVRDPAFWKRFSYAVHLDEETGTQGQSRPDLKHKYVPYFWFLHRSRAKWTKHATATHGSRSNIASAHAEHAFAAFSGSSSCK